MEHKLVAVKLIQFACFFLHNQEKLKKANANKEVVFRPKLSVNFLKHDPS